MPWQIILQQMRQMPRIPHPLAIPAPRQHRPTRVPPPPIPHIHRHRPMQHLRHPLSRGVRTARPRLHAPRRRRSFIPPTHNHVQMIKHRHRLIQPPIRPIRMPAHPHHGPQRRPLVRILPHDPLEPSPIPIPPRHRRIAGQHPPLPFRIPPPMPRHPRPIRVIRKHIHRHPPTIPRPRRAAKTLRLTAAPNA